MLPKTRLILSGGGAFDPVPNAKVMADMAIEMGVDKAALIASIDAPFSKAGHEAHSRTHRALVSRKGRK